MNAYYCNFLTRAGIVNCIMLISFTVDRKSTKHGYIYNKICVISHRICGGWVALPLLQCNAVTRHNDVYVIAAWRPPHGLLLDVLHCLSLLAPLV